MQINRAWSALGRCSHLVGSTVRGGLAMPATACCVPAHHAPTVRHAATAAAATVPPSASETVEVWFMDPRDVLDSVQHSDTSQRLADWAAQGHALPVRIPPALLEQLPQARLELGDGDDPLNAWVAGQPGELFQYNLAGTHSTRSGYTSALTRHALEQALSHARNTHGGPLPSWQAFLDAMAGDGPGGGTGGSRAFPPFLFAGRIIESHVASVYVLPGGPGVKQAAGVLVSSVAAD